MLEKRKRPLGDALGQVADPFEAAVDAHDGQDEPQVAGHGLPEGEDVEALGLDLDLHLVDVGVAVADLERVVTLIPEESVQGLIEPNLDDAAHLEDGTAKRSQIGLQIDGHVNSSATNQ